MNHHILDLWPFLPGHKLQNRFWLTFPLCFNTFYRGWGSQVFNTLLPHKGMEKNQRTINLAKYFQHLYAKNWKKKKHSQQNSTTLSKGDQYFAHKSENSICSKTNFPEINTQIGYNPSKNSSRIVVLIDNQNLKFHRNEKILEQPKQFSTRRMHLELKLYELKTYKSTLGLDEEINTQI